MKNTAKIIVYFIVMIGINFGQCFGNQAPYPSAPAETTKIMLSEQPINYSNQNFGMQGQEIHCPPESVIMTKDQYTALMQQHNVLVGQIAALIHANKCLYEVNSQRDESIRLLQQQSSNYCIKEELAKFIKQVKKELKSLKKTQNSQQELLNSLTQNEIQSKTATTNASQPTVIHVNTSSSSSPVNKIETITQQTNVETGSHTGRFYSKFINVKNLLATIFILGALIQEGPIGAAVVAIPVFAIGAFLNREEVKDYMNKLAIISCGSLVAVCSCFVAYYTYDKDLKTAAIIFIPVSLGLTALFAKM